MQRRILGPGFVFVLSLIVPAAALAGGPVCTAGTALRAMGPVAAERESRAALEASFERREREIRAVPRSQVAAEVRARAAELGVRASIERMVELFYQRAALRLALDRCSVAARPGPECPPAEERLRKIEAEFAALTGIPMRDFKGGRARSADRPRLLAEADLGGFGSTRTDPYNCVCTASVYNYNRWINRYWALECNNHGGHGVCSGNVDSAHSAGTGAMTGQIDVYFGDSPRGRECPDDHMTCFKGPQNGAWGNACNCDTIHSQFYNPYGSWYGGDLTESSLVFQGSFHDMLQDGPCDGSWIQVNEFIEENDPVCCDDWMGTLVATAQVQEGTSTTDVPASVQNCRGGSESGVYPYCGTFGATIRIVTTCQTRADDSFGSCSGRCGQVLPDATCNCDYSCVQYNDCCWDFCSACSGPGYPDPGCSVS